MTDHADIMAQVLAHLEEEQEKRPEIFYELRGLPEGPLRVDLSDMTGTGLPVPSPSDSDRDALWQRAAWAADWLSGRLCCTLHVWQVRVYTTIMGKEKRREESYVRTSCGGSAYWSPGGGTADEGPLHQVGSGGFCWECLKSDPDMDIPARGLVRHPVTPAEIGALPYRCVVCGVDVSQLGAVHEQVAHLVLFGGDARCESCGLGFRYATPEGVDYEPHRSDCPAVS